MEDNSETGKSMQEQHPHVDSQSKVEIFSPPPLLSSRNQNDSSVFKEESVTLSPPVLPDDTHNDSEAEDPSLAPSPVLQDFPNYCELKEVKASTTSLLRGSGEPFNEPGLHSDGLKNGEADKSTITVTSPLKQTEYPSDHATEENPCLSGSPNSDKPDKDNGMKSSSDNLKLQVEYPDVKNKESPIQSLDQLHVNSSSSPKEEIGESVQLSIDALDMVESAADKSSMGVSVDGVHSENGNPANNYAHTKQENSLLTEEINSSQPINHRNETSEEPENGLSKTELCSDKETPSNTEAYEVNEEDLKGNIDEFDKADTKFDVDVLKEHASKLELEPQHFGDTKSPNKSFLLDPHVEGDESGTENEQVAFMKELETFFKERGLDFKPPKFYGEGLNLLKLWRAVIRLGGYEQVTSCKLWRQVGESFKPPKTCTTVSWTFRCFYEKALLEYEKHKINAGELPLIDASSIEPSSVGNQAGASHGSGSGRARRDAAARAMQGWHSQRLLGNGEVGDPIIKDKISSSASRREKQLKSIGLLKRRTPSPVERDVKVSRLKVAKPQLETTVVDVGQPADWVKINVRKTKDCFEVYALVPGLLREEVRVQSDPAGRLVISGEPEHLDNPWGVTSFKKVVSLPSRIDPHQTSAVVTLHGQLFVRVPFEQSDS